MKVICPKCGNALDVLQSDWYYGYNKCKRCDWEGNNYGDILE